MSAGLFINSVICLSIFFVENYIFRMFWWKEGETGSCYFLTDGIRKKAVQDQPCNYTYRNGICAVCNILRHIRIFAAMDLSWCDGSRLFPSSPWHAQNYRVVKSRCFRQGDEKISWK